MALIWADSFDHYGIGSVARNNMLAGAWDHIGSAGVGVSAAFARTGQHSLGISQNVGVRAFARRTLPGATKFCVGTGFGLLMPNLPPNETNYVNNPHGVQYRNATGTSFSFSWMPDGSIVVSRGTYQSGQHVGSTDAGVLSAGSFQHVEFAVFIDEIVGWIEIVIDGVRVYRMEDADTGNLPITNIEYGATSSANFNFSQYIDDIFSWDTHGTVNTSFIGPVSIETVFATGDTDVADWQTVGAVSAYEAINEVPQDGDTSYVYAEEPGERIEFTLPELPAEIIALAGIYIPTFARIENVGIGRLRVSMVDGANVETGQEVPLTQAYSYRGNHAFQVNPTTGQPWTKADFENARVRVEKTL